MTNKYMTQEELLKWLAEAIHTETQKPENEIDWDFVEECENLMNAMYGDKPYYSKEEAEKRIAEIIGSKQEKEPETERKGGKLTKRTLITLILAATLLCASIGVFAASPLKDMMLKAINLNYGESVNDGTVTFINGGKSVEYDNIEVLLEKENLEIHFPKILPNDVKIEKVSYSVEDKSITIVCDDPTLTIDIEKYDETEWKSLVKLESSEINGYNVYFLERDDLFWAHIIIDNYIYIIRNASKDDLILIINNI